MSVIVVLALVHFLWQGALIGAVAALAIKLSRSATTRYAIGVSALVVMALAPVATATWLRTLNLAPTASNALTLNLAPPSDPNPAPQTLEPKSTRDVGPGTWDRMVQALGSVQVSAVQARWLFGFWLAGVTLLSLRLTLGWRSAQRLTRVGTSQPRSEILSHADALLRALNIRKAVSILESTLVHVPMAIGWLKPVVLLPAQSMTGLSIEQIDALIAHELAHIKRHDYLVNLLQSVLETMLFYHPAVWLISRRVRHERELCCDDLAIAVCNNDRVTYASALADMESLRQMAPPVLAANGGSLLERVKRVLTNSEAQASMSGGRDRLAAGLAVLAITVGLLGVQAQANKADSLLGAVTSPEGRHELAAGVRDALQTVRNLIPGESKTEGEANAAGPSSLVGLSLNSIVGGSGVLDLTRLGLTSVGTGSVVPPAQPQPLPAYRIEPGDLLTLDVTSGGVWQSEFSQHRYIVDSKGAIQVPLLYEPVTLSKMTLDEAAAAIRRALIEASKYSDLAVAVAPYVYRAGTPPAPIGPFRVGDDITIEVGARTDADWFALYATVQPNGRVLVQNIGEVQIAGRNSEQIMVDLVIAYRRQRGDAPSVSVRFDERSSRNKSRTERLENVDAGAQDARLVSADQATAPSAPGPSVSIKGHVKMPGTYPLSPGITLLELIAQAGSLLPTASGDVRIIRLTTAGPAGPEVVTVDVGKVPKGNAALAFELKDQDVVVVPRADTAYILGEIKAPNEYPIGADTTLIQLLTLAGGPTVEAATSRIRIVRTVNGKQVVIRNAPGSELIRPGDTVFVPIRYF